MKALLKVELSKAFRNKWFLLSLLVGCALVLVSAVGCLLMELDMKVIAFSSSLHFYPLSTLSVFNNWVVVDGSQSTTGLFFLLLPLLAVIPYSWSLLSERTSGYSEHLVARVGRPAYFAAKHLASFVSGGSVLLVPLVVNFVFCMCFSPFTTPEVNAVTSYGVYEESLWSGFFYNLPGFYCFLYGALIFVFGGLWAAFSTALSFVIKRRIPLLIAPYLFLILLMAVSGNILLPVLGFSEELTPFGYLRSVPASGCLTSWWVIAVEFALLFVFIAVTFATNRKRDLL